MDHKKISCPTCKKTINWEGNIWRPFCSERCKLIDLGEWAMEKYRIKSEESESSGEENEEEKKNSGVT